MSPDLNPIEHVWGMIGYWVQAVEPPLQTLLQLEASLHREWRQLPSEMTILSCFMNYEGQYLKWTLLV